jgi:phosphatidylinositol N-acetylglucosaminyltransferase subunit Y-like protein
MSEGGSTRGVDGTAATPSLPKHGASPGILSRFVFVRQAVDGQSELDENRPAKSTGSMTTQTQQPKVKRRKGSLRKAVLGREAQRDKRDAKSLTINTDHDSQLEVEHQANQGDQVSQVSQVNGMKNSSTAHASDSDGASESSEVTPWPELDDPASGGGSEDTSMAKANANPKATRNENLSLPQAMPTAQSGVVTSPTVSYKSTSTTDEEDALHMPQPNATLHRPDLLSSNTASYFSRRSMAQARRTSQAAKSPLSYAEVGLSTTTVQPSDSDWDYTETEWWGWVVLVVTWFVFVTGMGSCFGVWSWAWDVGTTPYAPPELENDETLPIVGYYPALLILTGVMSWIWVIVAWVGMKYFRHAKITGD